MREINASQITEIVRDLCIEANCHLPGDIKEAITTCRSCEPFPIAQTILDKIEENFNIWDFTLTEEEMAKINALDMGYAGTAVKHFDPDFVRMCTGRKIHD